MKKLWIWFAAAAMVCGCKDDEKKEEAPQQQPEEVHPVQGETIELELKYGVKMKMVWVNPGTFKMGSPESEEGRDDGETEHLVTLSSGFWIAQTEVSQREYMAMTEQNPAKRKGAEYPVENVYYEDAVFYAALVNALETTKAAHLNVRLPTEAEWEYAARGGAGGAHKAYAGANTLDDVGWWGANSGVKKMRGTKVTPERLKETSASTHPVAQKKPNPLGIYDMSGNVREWTSDLFSDYPASGATDPHGATSGTQRIMRGGSWFDRAEDCRISARMWSDSINEGFIGFRLVADVIPE
ncbi:MAG: SUMF1/EgtB/PvdO family nonheme iron enzyme [Kiritimatiellae bacterium]|nr:SUMF1/EgtB/PvdO family nonheme iron enzyme [Kiritimatiellia bacterium]